jgi:Fic family protein
VYLSEYNPYDIKDFLKAHASMTAGWVKEAGHFRSQAVGVFDGSRLIHAETGYQFVLQLITEFIHMGEENRYTSACEKFRCTF